MSKMTFSLPKPEAKKAKASAKGDTVVEGPFETTSAAGRPITWAIVQTEKYGLLFHVEPEGAKPLRIGRGKADTLRAVLNDAAKRNV
ncbi:MAG: hypothetical protein GY906_24525 [bacterium]|nr:hypothetical protein [bacterium]